MFDLINDIGLSVFTNVIQIAVGSILSVIIFKLINGKFYDFKTNISYSIIIIAAFSLLGLLMPMGTYGVVPLVLMLLAIGARHEFVLPILFSNVMFNLLISYIDISFSWKTGIGRIIFAFTAGIVAGIVFMLIKRKNEDIIRLTGYSFNGNGPNIFLKILSENINALGLFLIIGAIFNAVFYKYFLVNIVNAVFMNPILNNSLKVFLKFDIANPFVQYTFNLFFNLTSMAAFAKILKLKGIIIFIATYTVLTLLFSIITFI